jgi:hypothetical protein
LKGKCREDQGNKKRILKFGEENVLKIAIREGEILLRKITLSVVVGEIYFWQLRGLGLRSS